MDYEDFSIKIEPRQDRQYPVIVLHSPAGEGRASFALPFDPNEIGTILSDLGQTVRGSGKVPVRDVSPAATHTLPQRIGDQLFDALFSGPVRSLLDRSLGMIHGQQRGLRIKLHIDPEEPSLAQLASLPWEFLYRKETRDFLNLSRFTPILRYLDVQRPYTPLRLEPPLRILVVIANPADCPGLNLQRERALIEASWANLPGVQVEFMQPPTITQLQEQLIDQSYHVLHYMGHGGFDEHTGRGVLLMEDEQGSAEAIDGATLGVLLHDVSTLRLVFLNACETAKVTREKGLDPFAGVAASMVLAGIPAVVAMQFPITDSAAITFARRFYALLARGEAVDTAVAEGRRSIRVAEPDTMEWGTPVLFMRAPQGVIFQLPEAQRVKQPVAEAPGLTAEADRELEQRLEQLYNDGLGAYWLEDWDKAVRCFQAIADVRPDYQDALRKLEESKRQRKLSALYAQALAGQETQDWSRSLAALEELVALAPAYRDAASRLDEARKQKQLADLYAEAHQLSQAHQWQAVVNVFAQIHQLQPDFTDPDGLLLPAEREAANVKRNEELDRLINRALREMDAARWQEAQRLLMQVDEQAPGYRGADRLLEKSQAELSRQRDERQRQEQVATLYEQALGLMRARQWRPALAKMADIQALDPEFADPERIAARAQAEVTREEQEGQRQSELAVQYAEAVRLVQAKRYQEALEKWGEIQSRDPRYPDRQGIQATATKRLDELARGVRARRRVPGRAIAGAGALVLVVVAAVFLLWCRGGRCQDLFPKATPSPQSPVAVLDTPESAEPKGLASTTMSTPALPTKLPRPAPTPTMDADPAVYDNFDNPLKEGSYDQSRWVKWTNDPTSRAVQEDGHLTLEVNRDYRTIEFRPAKYLQTRLSTPTVFEAEMALDPMARGDSTGVVIDLCTITYSVSARCGISVNKDGQQVANCGSSLPIQSVSGTSRTGIISPGSWHTFRIEAKPQTMEFVFSIDGVEIAIAKGVSADETKNTLFEYVIALPRYGSKNSRAVAYIDNVRVGPLSDPTVWSDNMPCRFYAGETVSVNVPWLQHTIDLDGIPSDVEEWSDAACLSVVMREHNDGPPTVPARWWFKNDAQWLYVLARIPIAQQINGAGIAFFWPGCCPWPHSDGGSVDASSKTEDNYGWDESQWYVDIAASPPGQNNVEGKASKGSEYAWFEFRKALNSNDGYDWSWQPGNIMQIGDSNLLVLVWSDTHDNWYTRYLELQLGTR